MTKSLASPCVNVCVLDDAGRWCIGCGRSISEIANWSASSDEQKKAILEELDERLKRLSSVDNSSAGRAGSK